MPSIGSFGVASKAACTAVSAFGAQALCALSLFFFHYFLFGFQRNVSFGSSLESVMASSCSLRQLMGNALFAVGSVDRKEHFM